MPQAALNQAPNPTQTDDSFGSSLPRPDSCLSTYLVCLQTKQQRRWKLQEAYASQRGKFTERQFFNDRFGVHQRNPHWSLEETWKSFDRTGALRPASPILVVSTKWLDQVSRRFLQNDRTSFENWKKTLTNFLSQTNQVPCLQNDSRIYKRRVYKGNVSLENAP